MHFYCLTFVSLCFNSELLKIVCFESNYWAEVMKLNDLKSEPSWCTIILWTYNGDKHCEHVGNFVRKIKEVYKILSSKRGKTPAVCELVYKPEVRVE